MIIVSNILSIHKKYKADLCQFIQLVNMGGKTEEFVCDECGKSFSNYSYLNKHKKDVHVEVNPEHLQCPKCQQVFKSLRNFWSHIISVHESEQQRVISDSKKVPEEGESTTTSSKKSRKRQKETDLEEAEPSNQTCPHCQKEYPDMKQLLRHMNNVHLHPNAGKLLKCAQCDQKFRKEEMLEHHITESHAEKRFTDSLSFPCNFCSVTFNSVIQLWKHKFKEHGDNLDFKIKVPDVSPTCQYCAKTILGDYKTHIKEYHSKEATANREVPPCKTCGKQLSDLKTLQRHIALVHVAKRQFSCPICSKAFKNNYALEKHIVVHQTMGLETNIKAMLKSIFGSVCSQTLTCSICEENMKSSMEARVHMYIKHPETFTEFISKAPAGVSCILCSNSFESKEEAIEHVEFVHPGAKLPVCNVCGYKELKERDMNVHYKEFHPKVNRHLCDICNLTFSQVRELKIHNRREHGTFAAAQCPYCPERHVKVKLHVTVKHPERADEYTQLVKNAIKEEVEARRRFNSLIDPGGGKTTSKRKQKQKTKISKVKVVTMNEECEDGQNEIKIEVEEPPQEDTSESPNVPLSLDMNYTINKEPGMPHQININRLDKEHEPDSGNSEQQDFFLNMVTDPQDPLEFSNSEMDVKPNAVDANGVVEGDPNDSSTPINKEGSFSNDLCRPLSIRLKKLRKNELETESTESQVAESPPQRKSKRRKINS